MGRKGDPLWTVHEIKIIKTILPMVVPENSLGFWHLNGSPRLRFDLRSPESFYITITVMPCTPSRCFWVYHASFYVFFITHAFLRFACVSSEISSCHHVFNTFKVHSSPLEKLCSLHSDSRDVVCVLFSI